MKKQIQNTIVLIVILTALIVIGQHQKVAQQEMCLDQGQPIACSMLK